MNVLAIILGVLIIILLFILYQWYTSTAIALKTSVTDLKTQPPVITNIASPTNSQYAYGVWLYVNSWDPSQFKVIFSHAGILNVYLMNNQPTLCVDVKMSDDRVISTVILNSFPLQKWVYIIVSIDNTFLDVYLDGKLVKSAKLTNQQGSTFPKVPSQSSQVFLGNSNTTNIIYNGTTTQQITSTTPFSAFITNFYRWTVAMDPGTAWRYYLRGNGQTSIFSNLNMYGVQLDVTQNNVVTSSYKVF